MGDLDDVKQEKTPHRWKKGETGNPNGRPRKPEVDLLRNALEKARKGHRIDFLEHFVERAYENDNVAIALARKLIPDKIFSELEHKFNIGLGERLKEARERVDGHREGRSDE